MIDEQTLKVFGRVFNSEDGKDVLEYIIKLKNDNYLTWKEQGGDVYRGKAICYDEIISLFEKADKRILMQAVTGNTEWL